MWRHQQPDSIWGHNHCCVAGIQSSGSGSNIQKFLAPAAEQFGPKKQKKTLYYLYKSLAPETMSGSGSKTLVIIYELLTWYKLNEVGKQ